MSDGMKLHAAWVGTILALIANLFGIGYFARGLLANDEALRGAIEQHAKVMEEISSRVAVLDIEQRKNAQAVWSIGRMSDDVAELKTEFKELRKVLRK